MIKRAGELMASLGYDFVATGEVMNQRPMSQNKQSLGVVEKCSGLAGRLVRPLSAQLLPPTLPETEGKLDRAKLLALQGRRREEQFALAQKFGLVDYPSPAGGCKLTEKGFGRRLRDLMEHEGLKDRRLVDLLLIARRFRFPDGTGLVLGRDARENDAIRKLRRDGELLLAPVSVPGPTALVTTQGSAETLARLPALIAAWSKYDKYEGDVVVKTVSDAGEALAPVPRPYDREPFLQYQIF